MSNSDTNYWYIDESLKRLELMGNFVEIIQKLKPAIKESDQIIIMDNLIFRAFGIIKDLINEETINDNIITTFKIAEIKKIEEAYQLSDFAYSLPKVYKHFNNPEIHFNRRIGKLSEFEFKTIINSDFFISRTAFGKLFNSMHIEHRKTFITYVNKRDPELIFGKIINFVDLFNMLADYINFSIIQQIKFLKKSNDILREDLSVFDEVGFIQPISNEQENNFSDLNDKNLKQKPDIINEQVNEIIKSEGRMNFDLDFLIKNLEHFKQNEALKNKYFQNSGLLLAIN